MKLAAKFFILSLFLFSISVSASDFIVVSDYDDTAKISNVQSKLPVVWNAFFSNRFFIGMDSVYQSQSRQGRLIFLSSAPKILSKKIRRTIRKNGIRNYELLLRPLGSFSFRYKLKSLLKIVSETTSPLILIGDDTMHDPKVYSEVRRQFPSRIEAVYIRRILNKNLPVGMIPFYSSFELGLYEQMAGRMDPSDLDDIADVILATDSPKAIFPKFADCPDDVGDFPIDVDDLSDENQLVFSYLVDKCVERML